MPAITQIPTMNDDDSALLSTVSSYRRDGYVPVLLAFINSEGDVCVSSTLDTHDVVGLLRAIFSGFVDHPLTTPTTVH
jgi:hypothetical protein